jgi:hypothetical protein
MGIKVSKEPAAYFLRVAELLYLIHNFFRHTAHNTQTRLVSVVKYELEKLFNLYLLQIFKERTHLHADDKHKFWKHEYIYRNSNELEPFLKS